MGSLSNYIEFSKMRQLDRKAWPYKVRIENFDQTEHNSFVEMHPSIKVYLVATKTRWEDWEFAQTIDAYFTKESDLMLYKLIMI